MEISADIHWIIQEPWRIGGQIAGSADPETRTEAGNHHRWVSLLIHERNIFVLSVRFNWTALHGIKPIRRRNDANLSAGNVNICARRARNFNAFCIILLLFVTAVLSSKSTSQKACHFLIICLWTVIRALAFEHLPKRVVLVHNPARPTKFADAGPERRGLFRVPDDFVAGLVVELRGISRVGFRVP
jgi:hypothetical protein